MPAWWDLTMEKNRGYGRGCVCGVAENGYIGEITWITADPVWFLKKKIFELITKINMQ